MSERNIQFLEAWDPSVFKNCCWIQLICSISQEDNNLGNSWFELHIFAQTLYPFEYRWFEWNVEEDDTCCSEDVIRNN